MPKDGGDSIPIDFIAAGSDNLNTMSIDTNTIEEDLQAVTEAFRTGRPLDPEVAKRVDERAAEFRERMTREKGLQDICVPYTRQTREARP